MPQQLKLLPDGTIAFSASGARKLIRWDMATGTPTLCLQQKQGSRTKCVDVSADGCTAVVLLYDSSMAVYDIESGALRCDLMRKGERDAQRVHSGGVNGVLLTADGRTAVSWSKDATARVWDTTTGACLMVLQVCGVWAWSQQVCGAAAVLALEEAWRCAVLLALGMLHCCVMTLPLFLPARAATPRKHKHTGPPGQHHHGRAEPRRAAARDSQL
jgi:hypothetical protein